MPLITILSELSADLGVDITTATDRLYLIHKINQAARELYDSGDLKGCLREEMFNIGSTNQQVALPYYVDSLRGVRDYDSKLPITLQDMSPRYQMEGWKEDLGYKWRTKYKNHPIKYDSLTTGKLTISLSAAASQDFTVIITGQTATATRLQESVAFSVGQQTQVTVNNFLSIESIQKSIPTAEDLKVIDIDTNEIADIPNCEIKSSYTIVQVLDRYQTTSLDVIVECLYKTRFTPFVNDYDSFPCGDIYDKAIYWKTLEHNYAKQEGQENSARAVAAFAKVEDVITKIAENQETGLSMRMQFPRDRFSGIHLIAPRTWPQ